MAQEENKGNVEAKSLAETDFAWEDNTFFGINNGEEAETPAIRTGKIIGEVKDDLDKEEKDNDEDDDEDDEEVFNQSKESVELFKAGKPKPNEEVNVSASDNKGEDEGDEDNKEEGDKEDFYKVLLTEFKEKGVLGNVEIPETVTEDTLFELTDKEVEARVEETFQGFFEELDEDAVEFLKFKKAGGSTHQFLELYASTGIISTIDIEKEADQEKFLRNYYATVEDLDPEDIDAKIEFHKENKNVEKYAKKYYTKSKAQDEARKAQLVANQQERDALSAENRKKYIAGIKSKIDVIEEANGIPITPKDKIGFADYMTKPTVKIGTNRYITPFQAELNELLKTDDGFLAIGKLVRNKLNVSDIATKAVTQQTKGIKSRLELAKRAKPTTSSASAGKRSIVDFFPN